MGVGASSTSPEERGRNRHIERALKMERAKRQIPLLLLGQSQSGKSTIGTNVKFFFSRGFNDFERKCMLDEIRRLIYRNMTLLVYCAESFGIELEQEQIEIFRRNSFDGETKENIADAVKKLWGNQQIREAFEKSDQAGFRIPRSCSYFFDRADLFFSSEELPSNEDLVLFPFPTRGISETQWEIEKPPTKIRVVEVGQPNSEERKWIDSFRYSCGIIYVVALDQFDIQIDGVNSIQKSLVYFESTLRKWNMDAPVFVFLNKVDLFALKIQEKDLSIAFPFYKGGKNKNLALEFLKKEFTNVYGANDRIHVFVTEATNHKEMELPLRDMQQVCLNAKDFEVKPSLLGEGQILNVKRAL